MQTTYIEQVIREYLPQVVHMSLGTCANSQPWVCEVHFAYDDDLSLYFRSLTSRRHSQEIAHNPNVAGNIVKQHGSGEYPLGTYFEGVAQRLAPGPDQNKAFDCIHGRFNLGDKILQEVQREDGHQFYKITVQNWYVFGKLDGEHPQKYKLAWHESKK